MVEVWWLSLARGNVSLDRGPAQVVYESEVLRANETDDNDVEEDPVDNIPAMGKLNLKG